MAFTTRHSIASFLCYSSKLTLVLVIISIISETCILCTAAEEGGEPTNAITNGEVVEEIGNPELYDAAEALQSFHPLGVQSSDDDMVAYKRHLGAVAALSGSKSSTGSKFFISPSKKHLGSIAAQSFARMGRKADQMKEMGRNEMLIKRHLGSLMALSRSKPKPLTRSLKSSMGYQMDSPAGTYELETPALNYVMDSQGWANERDSGRDSGVTFNNIIPDVIQSPPEEYFNEYSRQIGPSNEMWHQTSQLGYEVEPSSNNELLSTSLPQTDNTMKDEFSSQNSEPSMDDVSGYKSKRFLGPLARGGWFPRHFRGIISENSFGKRHIGALARLGWMPHAKGNSRLGLLDEQRGEIGLKRNDASPRRRMLYHFTAPSLWTSPRGK